MPVPRHDDLRQLCTPQTGPQASITCEKAFLSARRFEDVTGRTVRGQLMYLGKISRGAFAAAIDNVTIVDGICQVPEPDQDQALSAESIGFKCTERPGPHKKYRRTGEHNANHNQIEGSVRCWIVNSYSCNADG